jgi:hypothetical protein
MIPLNFFAIITAAAVAFFVGFLWHGPLFGKQWMKVAHIKMPEGAELEKAKRDMWKPMVMGFLSHVVMAFVLAHSIYYFLFATMSQGTTHNWVTALNAAFWNWLGFVAVATVSPVLWEKKTWAHWAFGAAYWFVVMCVMSLIITYWQ